MTGEEIIQIHLGGQFMDDEMRKGSEELLRCAAWMTEWTKKKREIYYECCGNTLTESEQNTPEEEWALSQAVHRTNSVCPYCRREVYHINRRHTSQRDYTEVYTVWYRMSRTQPNTLLVLGMWSGRRWYKGKQIHPSFIQTEHEPCSLVMLPWGAKPERHIRERLMGLNGYDRWFWGARGSGEWAKRRDIQGGDMQSLEGGRIDYLICNKLQEVVTGTRWEKVLKWANETSNVNYSKDRVLPLYLFCDHPAMEYMIGNGLEGILKSCLRRDGTLSLIRWKQKTPQKMFQLDGNELARLRRMKPEETNGLGLMALHYAKLYGQKVKIEEAMQFSETLRYHAYTALIRKALSRYGERWGVMKILRYAVQRGSLTLWMDYMQELYILGEADSEERVFPKDLHEAHAQTGARIKFKNDAETAQKVEQMAQKWAEKFTFEACGLRLEPFASAVEIVAEGRIQKICIGNYVSTYAAGNTILLKLRRKDKPEEPFHAVEISRDGKRLIQCRGYMNYTHEADKAQVLGFWAEWDRHHQTKTDVHLVINPHTREAKTA